MNKQLEEKQIQLKKEINELNKQLDALQPHKDATSVYQIILSFLKSRYNLYYIGGSAIGLTLLFLLSKRNKKNNTSIGNYMVEETKKQLSKNLVRFIFKSIEKK